MNWMGFCLGEVNMRWLLNSKNLIYVSEKYEKK